MPWVATSPYTSSTRPDRVRGTADVLVTASWKEKVPPGSGLLKGVAVLRTRMPGGSAAATTTDSFRSLQAPAAGWLSASPLYVATKRYSPGSEGVGGRRGVRAGTGHRVARRGERGLEQSVSSGPYRSNVTVPVGSAPPAIVASSATGSPTTTSDSTTEVAIVASAATMVTRSAPRQRTDVRTRSAQVGQCRSRTQSGRSGSRGSANASTQRPREATEIRRRSTHVHPRRPWRGEFDRGPAGVKRRRPVVDPVRGRPRR